MSSMSKIDGQGYVKRRCGEVVVGYYTKGRSDKSERPFALLLPLSMWRVSGRALQVRARDRALTLRQWRLEPRGFRPRSAGFSPRGGGWCRE